jgi:hypothetical protein
MIDAKTSHEVWVLDGELQSDMPSVAVSVEVSLLDFEVPEQCDGVIH